MRFDIIKEVLLYFMWWLLRLQAISLLGQGIATTAAQKLWRRWPDPGVPSLSETVVNITVVAGRTASMPCRVANLGDKTVSWIRGIDLTVLAVDRITYTGDPRFTVKHPEDTNDWLLELRDVTSADEGTYDCQVNTHPKLSTKVYLDVVPRHSVESSLIDMAVSDTGLATRKEGVSRKQNPNEPFYSETIRDTHDDISLKIRGEKLVNIKIGKTLKLTCEATGKGVEFFLATRNNEERLLDWMLDEVPVTSLFAEWKVKVRETSPDSTVTSEMTIDKVGADDTGVVTCLAPGTGSTSVNLQVIEEKSTDQHYSGTSSSKMQKDPHKHPYQLTSAVSSVGKKSGINSGTYCSSPPLSLLLVLLSLVYCTHYKIP